MFRAKQMAEFMELLTAISEEQTKIMARLDDIDDTLSDISEKLEAKEPKKDDMSAKIEIGELKAKSYAHTEFVQNLVLQLIATPQKEVAKEVSPAVAAYLAKKPNGADTTKPKLP